MKNLMLFCIAAIFACGAIGCKKAKIEDECLNGSFTGTINGNAFTAKTYNNTVKRSVIGGDTLKHLEIRATDATGKVIILSIINFEGANTGKCVPVKDYYVNDSLNYHNNIGYESAVGTYMTDSITVAGQTFPVAGASGKISVSSCDENGLKISGSFSFTVSTNGSDPKYQIEGTFADMCYTYSE